MVGTTIGLDLDQQSSSVEANLTAGTFCTQMHSEKQNIVYGAFELYVKGGDCMLCQSQALNYVFCYEKAKIEIDEVGAVTFVSFHERY